ncbi:MAG TPA: hypothetical protein EYQ65_05995 [Cycloclasticus sp.]|nr:hypothetical protein [Cycloclasticus sp.]
MIGTRDQWKPFYATSRPCLADLVVDGASLEEIEKLYPPNNKLLLANGLSIQAEDFFSDMGSGQWLQFAVTPIKNRRGRTIGAVETFVDISARIQAEKFYCSPLKPTHAL